MIQPWKWPHLMTALNIQHWSNGRCIWQQNSAPNLLHSSGEEFLLSIAFSTVSGFSVPSAYYLGLDNRVTIQETDTMSSLQNEPTGYGYSRATVSSTSGFTVAQVSGVWTATSIIVSFTASGGSWGPVRNLFLTDKSDNSGSLIATAPLSGARTLSSADTLTMRIALTLANSA